MKKAWTASAIVAHIFIVSPGAIAQSRLPTCPSWPFAVWNNCQGEKTYDNGGRYVGEFKDGTLHGQGAFTYPNGDQYIGEFRSGIIFGKGVWVTANGDRYSGVFSKGLSGHFGVTYANGDSYVGELKAGKKDGQGTLTFFNGDRFIGAFKDDKFHGKGTFQSSKGERYVGEFRDGKREGQAVLYSGAKSIISSGFWSDDRYIGISDVEAVKLELENGVYLVPIRLNDAISFNAVIDSGASDVSIPADIVMTLIRTKTLSSEDFLGEQRYRLADGSIIPSRQFRIRSLKVGNKTLENVVASIASVKAEILLGQTFLNRFKSWSIDNERQLLKFK